MEDDVSRPPKQSSTTGDERGIMIILERSILSQLCKSFLDKIYIDILLT